MSSVDWTWADVWIWAPLPAVSRAFPTTTSCGRCALQVQSSSGNGPSSGGSHTDKLKKTISGPTIYFVVFILKKPATTIAFGFTWIKFRVMVGLNIGKLQQ